MRDPLIEAMLKGEKTIKLRDIDRPLTHTILAPPFRDYFIKRVKAPFLKAVVFFSKKYPEPTKQNCTGNWTEPFMDAFDKLIAYANYREDFFLACRRITLGEIEHDNLYRDPIIMMLESLIEDMLDGKIPAREEGCPPSKHWREPTPYGGKYTIIYKIRAHRQAINDLLGRKHIEEGEGKHQCLST